MKFSKIDHPNCVRGHNYALEIVSGKILASDYVIGACNRYLRDLENKKANWTFDVEAAEKYLRLVQRFDHAIGKWPTPNIVYEPWQCWVWMCIMGFKIKETGFRRFRTAHVEVARGNGKALALDTIVPTPDGMKEWKDIKVGSRLYSRDGTICRVVGKNRVHYPQAYEVSFSDGEKVVCSGEHLWFTSNKTERVREKRHVSKKTLRQTKSLNLAYESVRTCEQIHATLSVRKGETNHSVKNSAAVVGTKQKLPIDPYLLGYWLGNGDSTCGRISCHTEDYKNLAKLFAERGYPCGKESRKKNSNGSRFLPEGLRVQLKAHGFFGNKHIPEAYFLAPVEDRLELVRGLLDSDGSIGVRGQTEFTNKEESLVVGLARLLHSLGYKIHRRRQFKVHETNNYKSRSTFHRLDFSPRGDQLVFNLKRKLERQIAKMGKYTGQRYIVGCRKLKKKYPMFCVQVDSDDSSYLVGEGHIPTHNSPMASTCALYLLALDDPNGNQISTVATKKDQARIVLDSARTMAMKSASFLRKTGIKVLAHGIVHPESNSSMRALASDSSSMDGLNDILGVCDELHAMKRDTFEVISSGMSKRKDSLLLCITTAGADVDGVGHSQSAYAKKVCLGEVDDDTFFAVVYCLADKDDWTDEKNWIKANPNLGVSVDLVTLKAKVEKASITPADIPNIKTKHMNLWISEAEAFFDLYRWDQCVDPAMKISDFRGKQCRAGIDLASVTDICSTAFVFREKGIFYLFDKSYIPEETAKEAKNALYDECIANGHLIATPGAAINNHTIRKDVELSAKEYRIQECAYDAWNATEMANDLSAKIEMVKFAMTVANFSEAMKKLDSAMREGKVRHNGSPLLRWCLGNVVAKRDHNDNVFPRKNHLKLKIDPIIAILMGIALWLQTSEKDSVYEQRGILTL